MRIRLRLAALAFVAPLAACASSGSLPQPATSAVELRALQTRSYPAASRTLVMQALLDALRDDGLRITSSDPELGLLVAEKEHVSQPGTAKRLLRGYAILATYGTAALLPWQGYRRTVLELTAQVDEVGGDVRVRLGLQLRVLDKGGRLQEALGVVDGAAYQAVFARLDKSLYLRREGL